MITATLFAMFLVGSALDCDAFKVDPAHTDVTYRFCRDTFTGKRITEVSYRGDRRVELSMELVLTDGDREKQLIYRVSPSETIYIPCVKCTGDVRPRAFVILSERPVD